jgi:hypothetical protein
VTRIDRRAHRRDPLPGLHHHRQNQPPHVVPPLGVFRRFQRATVVNLGIEIRHRHPQGRSPNEWAPGIGLAADHQGRKAALGIGRIVVMLGKLGCFHRQPVRVAGRSPADTINGIRCLRLPPCRFLAGQLDLNADFLQRLHRAAVEGGRCGTTTVKADFWYPVISCGDVAHRRPEDAAAGIPCADDNHIQRRALPVVFGDPFHQLSTRQPVRFADHIDRRGQRIGVHSDLRQQPHAAFRHGGLYRLLDFLRPNPIIGASQFVERFRLHESSQFRKRQFPFFAKSLEYHSLDPLIVGGVGGVGGPVPLNQPECPHQWPDFAARCRTRRQSHSRDERKRHRRCSSFGGRNVDAEQMLDTRRGYRA